MPARKIPKNYKYLTGIVASAKSVFEATLERDFYILMGWDKRIARIEGQPVTLTYRDKEGATRPYTPDALVFYKPDTASGYIQAPRLFEVKPREIIHSEWPEIKRKYKEARRFARLQGWSFGFITEIEIRTPYLDNIKFLRRFTRQPPVQADRELLLSTLDEIGETTPDLLIMQLASDQNRRGGLLSSLWKLVVAGEVNCDLRQSLTMQSPIYCNTKYKE